MNGFRVTILTLLCLSVGLMFYAVLVVIPGWQGQYSAYQSSLRIAEYEKKNDIHRQQMMAFDPSFEAPEVEQARLDEEEAARRNEMSINEAEENNVMAAARRKEESARARAEAEEAARPKVIGIVASYDQGWECIMIKPAVPEAFTPGVAIAMQRDGRVVCEAVVDSRDAESGQISATVKSAQLGGGATDMSHMTPAVGDEVILSPFQSSSELRGESVPTAPAYDTPAAGDSQSDVPPLEPMPEEPTFTDEEAGGAPVPAPAAEAPTPAPAAEAPAAEPSEQGVPALTPPPADVKKALDSLVPQTPAPDSSSGSNSKLPSLDAMLHNSLF